jgi:carbohydrate esterase-like protein/GDSL-like lipase/acylhydrolase family protein
MSRFASCALVLVAVLAGCGDDPSSATGSGASAGSGGQPAGPGGGGSGAVGGSGASGGGGAGGMEETALVHRVGRFVEDPAGPVFSWSGTSFRTRIDGPSLSVHLDGAGGVYFEIVVDGASTGTFQTTGGDAVYDVVQGLPAGEHDVEIHRRNEGFFGDVQLLELVGSLVESPSPYAHRMEYIGDSITCGYGIEGLDGSCEFSGDTESAYTTYAAIAARNVGAAAHIVAYSGKGVFQNYGGNQVELMPELWLRTLTNSAAPAWDFTSFVPEAVVVNLGTNDFSTAIQENDFVSAYVAFLGAIRGNYPSATIFCVTWQGWGATQQGYVTSAIAQFGDADVHQVDFAVDPADGWGCDYHPNLVMHAKLGAQLTTVLQTTLGW